VLGVGTAATLLAIDLIYVPPRRIPVTFLVDAAAEIAWLSMWARTGQPVAGDLTGSDESVRSQ